MAAIAVLAVAFAVFAAIPAVADDSDAAEATEVTTADALVTAVGSANFNVKLGADITLASQLTINKTGTIDFDGKTIFSTLTDKNAIVIKSTSGAIEVQFKNGSIDASKLDQTKETQAVSIGTYKGNDATVIETVKLVDMDIKSNTYGIGVFGKTTLKNEAFDKVTENVQITGGSIEATNWPAVSTNGMHGGELITIQNAALKSANHVAIFAPSNGKFIIDGCTTIEGVSGIDQRAGSISVEKSTIKYNGPNKEKSESDGPVAFGVGISVMPVEGYSTVGTTMDVGDKVEFVKGDNANDQIFVSAYKYITASYNSAKTTVGKVPADVSVTYEGFKVQYTKDTSNASATVIGLGDSIDLTVGAGSTVAVSQDVTGKLTNNGVVQVAAGKTLDVSATSAYTSGGSSKVYLASGATLKVPVSTTVTNVKAAADAKIFIGGTDTALTEDQKKSEVTVVAEFIEAVNGGVEKVYVIGAITLSDDIVIPEGTSVTTNGTNKLTLSNGKTLTVNGAFTGTIEGVAATGGNNGVAKLENFNGDFQVKAGSLEITGASLVNGKITVVSGDIVIDGKINGDIEFIADSSVSNATVTFRNVTVGSGAVITLVNNTNIAYKVEGAMNLYGSIVSVENVDLTVPNNAAFKAYSGAQISKVNVVGAGKIDLTQAQNPQSVGEDISYDKTYGQLENVTVVGSLTIKNNSTVTVKGGFQVNEGVTVTIEKGSKLIINSLAASMIVDGRIVVEEGATLEVKNAKDVKVSGSIDSDGTVIINSTVTIKSGGAITINDGTVAKYSSTVAIKDLYKSTFEPKKGLVVEAGATLTIKSLMYSTAAMNINNKGTVVFDKAIIGGNSVTVNMLADGAVVQVLSIENIPSAFGTDGKVTTLEKNNLIITDDKLEFADKKVVGSPDGCKANKLTIAPGDYAFKGLTVVEKVTSYTDDDGKKQYDNNLDIAGAVSVSKIKDTPSTPASFSVEGDRVAVSGELTLGKDVLFEVKEMAKLSVSGKLVATEEAKQIDNKGEITVTGLVQATKDDAIGTINAAMYESKIGTTTVYNYTTLKAAIDFGAKDITVSGKIYVTESVTVPAGVTIKNNGEIVVGSAGDTEVVLTVADTASIKYGKVIVDGTLYFENKKDNKAAEIESDVSVIGEKDARYTNLFTALNNANAGETVTVDKTTVDLKKSITIKEGVTLDVPNSKALKVYAGVTITVNGTLKTAEKIETATFTKTDGTEAQVTFDLAADKLNGKAAIIVNGVFMSGVEFSYDGAAPAYMIPGAYYSLTDDAGAYNYVTTLENASKTAATVVTVYGKVSAGDVVFTGTDSEPKTVTVAAGADLTVASITLDKASFEVKSTGRFTGDVKVGDSAVTVKNVKVEVSIDKNGHMVVETVSKNVTGTETASFKIAAGSIHIREAFMDVTVASGATLASDSEQTILKAKLTIEGTVSVANEQTITVKDDVTVKGALSVADATDSKIAGTFNAEKNLYIGLTPKDVTGDAASVSGAVSEVQVAFVKADANVSDATIESFKVDGVLKSTTYVVEGKDWMTVYDRTGNYYIGKVTEAPFENAEFKANKWLSTDGESADNKVIGASKCDKVTANIEYKIYTIQITPCAGVESIAIDGNLVGYDDVKVKAGSHTVTYSLANGYSGEAKLSLVETGDKTTASVSGQTFTVGGENGVVKLQLTGVEKSGYVDPVVPEQKDDDGLSLTDILLIVLVVLIVIMAVIVAMRLMRS